MRRRLAPLLLLCALALPARAEIVVVAHPNSPLRELSVKAVADLYLGRTHTAASGERLLLLDHPRDSQLRERFFQALSDMDLRRVNAYWARLQFSGDTQPPLPLPDSNRIIEAVRSNPLAVGYIEAGLARTAGLRTLLRLEE